MHNLVPIMKALELLSAIRLDPDAPTGRMHCLLEPSKRLGATGCEARTGRSCALAPACGCQLALHSADLKSRCLTAQVPRSTTAHTNPSVHGGLLQA